MYSLGLCNVRSSYALIYQKLFVHTCTRCYSLRLGYTYALSILIVFCDSDDGTTIADVNEIETGGDCMREAHGFVRLLNDRRARHTAATFAKYVVALRREEYFESRVFNDTAAHDERTTFSINIMSARRR